MPPHSRGRPRVADPKRYPVNVRMSKAMYDKFQAASKRSGRSMSQELEIRVMYSFLVEDARDTLLNMLE